MRRECHTQPDMEVPQRRDAKLEMVRCRRIGSGLLAEAAGHIRYEVLASDFVDIAAFAESEEVLGRDAVMVVMRVRTCAEPLLETVDPGALLGDKDL